MAVTSGPADHPPPVASLALREITKQTLRTILKLEVAPDQTHFVASNAVSVAEAYYDRENAWFRGIYAEDTPVGFVMMWDEPEEPTYYLWRFMIDHRFQRRGYGWRALELIVEHVRTRPGARELLLSYVPGEGSPGEFYHKFGFVDTGEVHEGELEASYSLQ